MGRRLVSSLPVVLVGVVAVGCGIAFAPGDYPPPTVDAGGAPAADGAAPAADAGDASAGERLLIVGGERDLTDVAGNDVWSAAIGADGELGAFENLQAGLYRGAVGGATIADGWLFAVVTSGATRSIEFAPFERGFTGPWQGAAAPVPQFGAYAQVFAGSSLVSFGGGTMTDAGGEDPEVPIYDDRIHVLRFTPDPPPPTYTGPFNLEEEGVRLPVAARDMLAVAYQDFVYILGGSSDLPPDAGQATAVYVARRDPATGVTGFTATTSVSNEGAPYAPTQPILCTAPGHLVMAGGSGTDIVLTVAVKDDGTLGAWTRTKSLPGPLRAAGCAFFAGKLHLFGGVGATSRSDRILRAPLNADGTLGDWEISPRNLPGPRSSIAALVY